MTLWTIRIHFSVHLGKLSLQQNSLGCFGIKIGEMTYEWNLISITSGLFLYSGLKKAAHINNAKLNGNIDDTLEFHWASLLQMKFLKTYLLSFDFFFFLKISGNPHQMSSERNEDMKQHPESWILVLDLLYARWTCHSLFWALVFPTVRWRCWIDGSEGIFQFW